MPPGCRAHTSRAHVVVVRPVRLLALKLAVQSAGDGAPLGWVWFAASRAERPGGRGGLGRVDGYLALGDVADREGTRAAVPALEGAGNVRQDGVEVVEGDELGFNVTRR